MSELPQNVYSNAAVRALDRCAIEEHGVPGGDLMARAGSHFFEAAVALDKTPWCIVCGVGNNAGDGYVVARLALEAGLSITVVAASDPAQLKGDAHEAYRDFIAAGGIAVRWDGALPDDVELIIDALLGSGIDRDVEGDYRDAISAMNAHSAPVFAVDLPSGLDGDTGRPRGLAVIARWTMTFVGLKTGSFLADGPSACGELLFGDLAIPEACEAKQAPVLQRLRMKDFAQDFQPRSRTAHKGDFGHVVVVGGGPGMPGAVLLAGRAALRVGAGRVTVVTHPSHAAALAADTPELMISGVATGDDATTTLASADVVVFGPGLGQTDWATSLEACVRTLTVPTVWDADALNLLARRPDKQDRRILTPHPGEAARLLQTTSAAVQHDRLDALRELQHRYGGTVVLKGAGTLIASRNGIPSVCSDGNPGMASPGMGDVLSGVVGGLVAQGLTAEHAVLVHARAGDRAARAGERGLLASDVIEELRNGVNS